MTRFTADALARACAERMWSDDTASRVLGMTLTHVAPGEARITMPVTANMVQGHGTCHGGSIFTLADSAFAFACNSRNQRCVAQHAAITYLAPGKLGDVLTAHAREVNRRGRSGLYDVRVTRADGTVIAEFRGHSRAIEGLFFPDAEIED
jgi:acyl-CoA thioesterase